MLTKIKGEHIIILMILQSLLKLFGRRKIIKECKVKLCYLAKKELMIDDSYWENGKLPESLHNDVLKARIRDELNNWKIKLCI